MSKRIEWVMELFDNPKNRRKADCLCALDIMFDDIDNPLPEEFIEYFNNEAGLVVPWGTKFKITIEEV